MRRVFELLLSIIVLRFSYAHTQSEESAISPRVSNALTRVIGTDRVVTAGLFVGFSRDSIYLSVAGRLQAISRHQIWKLTIERRAETLGPTVAGFLLGVYAGNLMFLKEEGQPYAFFQKDDAYALYILENAAFALVGGGIGYLVGATTESEESFDFTESENANQDEWSRLRGFVSETNHRSKVHFSFRGAWVVTYIPNSTDVSSGGLPSSGASNLNMMRKMQLTISIAPIFDAGFAVMWLGQPSSFWYDYSSSVSTNGSMNMTGHGYYAVGLLRPLHSIALRKFQWDVGAGVGFASVKYDLHQYSYSYTGPSQTSDLTIEKTVFSGVIYTEVKVFVTDYLSLGIIGDYVFIPKKIPAIEEISVESRGMGTASIGFALGLHF